MKLSILDQSPISSGQTPRQALLNTVELARTAEKWGYTRFWVTEHHDMAGLACSSPEVLLSYIGAVTNTIRIGSGAVLLPNYKPYKVAENFNMLATLFPGRIDLGVGRAPGGSAEASLALSDNFLKQVYTMPSLVEELLHFLHLDFPDDHMFANLKAAPVPNEPPEIYLLGTSEKSAKLAASSGTGYVFGQFMSDQNGLKSLNYYRDHFQPKGLLKSSKTLLTISAICAETTAKAEELARSSLLWQLQLAKGEGNTLPSVVETKHYPISEEENIALEKMKKRMILGNPQEVKQQLLTLQQHYYADEIMILTNVEKAQDKLNSYQLLAEEMFDN